MAAPKGRAPRRADALTRDRIVDVAIELLDTAGENGLTFRALTERLATGPGAIYWHLANKDELLAAATDALIATALKTEPAESAEPQDIIRAVALGLFEAIDAHPWLAGQLATQLARDPRGSVTPRIFERIGQQVQGLAVPVNSWFTTTSVLVHYILGAAGQNAVNARTAGPGVDRAEFLDAVSLAWKQLDAQDYPFARAIAEQARVHDDRAEFLAGITLILAGITAVS